MVSKKIEERSVGKCGEVLVGHVIVYPPPLPPHQASISKHQTPLQSQLHPETSTNDQRYYLEISLGPRYLCIVSAKLPQCLQQPLSHHPFSPQTSQISAQNARIQSNKALTGFILTFTRAKQCNKSDNLFLSEASTSTSLYLLCLGVDGLD